MFSCKNNPSTTRLHFEITSQELQTSDSIFIVGNKDFLGNWNPAKVPMVFEQGAWKATFEVNIGDTLEYKFTKGAWDKEATTAEGQIPSNSRIIVRGDTTIRYEIPHWRDTYHNPAQSKVTGNAKYHRNMEAKGLKPRDVIVWLPPSYESNPKKRYPVLYMHDGQNVFDPSTSTLQRDWGIDEIADSLIRKGAMEEIIIVAIYCNPEHRRDEYAYEELGNRYQDFMCCQLKPFIDETYRTKTDAANTATMGASMGGLISFILAWEYPQVFGHAACMSPAFKIQQFDYVPHILKENAKRKIDLYIDNGTLGLEAKLQPGIDEVMKVLKEKDYVFTWYLDEGADHNEMAWGKRAWRPLMQFFSKK